MAKDFDKPEIGKLWINKEERGKPSVFSGEINGEKVLILVNRLKFKQKSGAPDYNVFSCDREITREDNKENEYVEEENIEVSDDEFDF